MVGVGGLEKVGRERRGDSGLDEKAFMEYTRGDIP